MGDRECGSHAADPWKESIERSQSKSIAAWAATVSMSSRMISSLLVMLRTFEMTFRRVTDDKVHFVVVLTLVPQQMSLLDYKGELQCFGVNTDLPTFPILQFMPFSFLSTTT